MTWKKSAVLLAIFVLAMPARSFAWGGLGHRTVAAIAMELLPAKAPLINKLVSRLEIDNTAIDAASYPDEFIRPHDAIRKFSHWHYADLPDDTSTFVCGGDCLFDALELNRAKIGAGRFTKNKAVAMTWVLHLIGDLHQPLHLSGRLRGGNDFPVKYRGHSTCHNGMGGQAKVELHSVWDDCLIAELAHGRDPKILAKDLLAGTTDYRLRPEAAGTVQSWAAESHALANSAAFGTLQPNTDLGDAYISGNGKAMDIVARQLLRAGIRLAAYLDKNFMLVR